jgi:Tfp pilus tip-associated adhesin PilY1
MAVVDLDGDGYVEIVSAGYTAGKVYVHTFAPETN